MMNSSRGIETPADKEQQEITGSNDAQNPRKFFGYCTDYHLLPVSLKAFRFAKRESLTVIWYRNIFGSE